MTPPTHPGGGKPREQTDQSSQRDANRQLWAAADSGWVLTVELITAVFTWGGIGWLLDRWLGTAPWLLITGFTVGWVTGIYLAWLRFGRSEPRDQPVVGAGGAQQEGGVSADEER